MSFITPTLHTSRLLLRPFTEADKDSIFELQSNAKVLRYWDAPAWTELAQADNFLAKCKQMEQEERGIRLAIERIEDGKSKGEFIGWCAFFKWDPEYRSGGIGYCLAENAWGQGYATEAASALLTWAYDTLDLNRVQSETDTRNIASAKVLEKLGFVLEGTLREDCIVNGEVSDSWVFGLLRRDWESSKL